MSGKGSAALGMALNATAAAFNRTYSPIALSQDWAKLSRLIFVVIMSIFGSIMNVFFIASFFVVKKLSNKGNVFLALVGLSDLMITGGVMSISAVVLLSGQWDNTNVCHGAHFITEVATYTFSIFFMIASVEQYCQMGCTPWCARKFVNLAVNPGVLIVYSGSVAAAAYGVYHGYDYDYCERLHHGNHNFRTYTSVLFHLVPGVITVILLVLTICRVQKRAVVELHYKRSQRYVDEYSRSVLNMLTYVVYVCAWSPYLIIINQFPKASDAKFYQCAWLGICRSVLTSIFYCTLNKDFRRGFGYLYKYCFCKTTLTGPYYTQNTRYVVDTDVSVNVRRPLSPRRPATRTRENLEL